MRNEDQDETRQQHDDHHQHQVHIKINGTEHKTHRGGNSVEHLKHLGKVAAGDILCEVKDGKSVDLKNEDQVEIHGGEEFLSRKREVDIRINEVDRKTHPGENSVRHLREWGHVPADEMLSQFKDGQFVELADKACVDIHGGKIFSSHRKSGGSS